MSGARAADDGGPAPGQPLDPSGLVAATGLRVRPERDDDVPFLRALYRTSRDHEPGALTWPAGEREAFLDRQFEAQRLGYRQAFPRAAFWVLYGGEGSPREDAGGTSVVAGPVGRLYLDLREDEIRLVDILLRPEARGRGLGTRVLRWLTGEAARRRIAVRGHVEWFNPARRLYERLGFRPVATDGAHQLLEWRAS